MIRVWSFATTYVTLAPSPSLLLYSPSTLVTTSSLCTPWACVCTEFTHTHTRCGHALPRWGSHCYIWLVYSCHKWRKVANLQANEQSCGAGGAGAISMVPGRKKRKKILLCCKDICWTGSSWMVYLQKIHASVLLSCRPAWIQVFNLAVIRHYVTFIGGDFCFFLFFNNI